MSDLLREWLIHQLGVGLHSLHPDNLCSQFQNGVLIGRLLQNYNIVSSCDFSLLVDEDDEAIKRSNFEHLKVWLKMINISLDDDTVDGIILGRRSIVFGLLYKLCFFLEDPNNLHLIRYVQQLHKSFGTIDLLNISNSCENTVADDEERNSRLKYSFNDVTTSLDKSSGYSGTVYDKINEFEQSLPTKLESWNLKGDRSCTRFLSNLKAQKQHSKLYDAWRKEVTSTYLRDSFNVKMRHNQNVLRDKSMPEKLTRMSEYEKKMVDHVNSARLVMKTRNTIVVKNKVRFCKGDNNDTAADDRGTLSEEFKSSMKERVKSMAIADRAAVTRNAMRTLVRELIDISAECGAYRRANGRGVPKRWWDDWKETFVRGTTPLSGTADGRRLGLLLDATSAAADVDEQLAAHSALNRRDLAEYLKRGAVGEAVAGRSPDGGSEALGFVVHDVFSSVYALPAPSAAVDDATLRAPVRAILNVDVARSGDVRGALVQREILPVVPDTALHYCLCAFYRETDNSVLVEILERHSENVDSEGVRGSLSDNEHSSTTPTWTGRSVQTQTCGNSNERHDSSERIECGKNAFVYIYKGKPVPKHCLIDCVLCYIKEKRTAGGWVIIGFSPEEVMILEERLANKHHPPFGTYGCMKNVNPTIIVRFAGPDFGDSGRYPSSLTGCLQIAVSFENQCDGEWTEAYSFYRSQGLLTLLQSAESDLLLDGRRVDLICNVLTGRIVNWSEESHWIWCIDYQEDGKSKFDAKKSKSIIKTNGVFKNKRLEESKSGLKNDLSAVNYQVSTESFNPSAHEQQNVVEVKSQFVNVYLDNNVGVILAKFWKFCENEYVKNMESCFFYRRILFSEQEPYIVSTDRYLREMLFKPNAEKIKLVRRLQSDLFDILNTPMTISDVTKQLSLAVSDATLVLLKWTNEKIEKCRQLIGSKNIERWLDTQIASLIKNYKCILQIEVDRIVNTLLFINSYMSKLHNQELLLSVVPSKIEVSLEDLKVSKINMTQGMKSVDDYARIFKATVKTVNLKVLAMFSTIMEWLDEIKETQNTELIQKHIKYLKTWTLLIDAEKLRSADQLKYILDMFLADIKVTITSLAKEMDDCFIEYRLDTIQQINDRLQYELSGIELVCNLFETAVHEMTIVRHEILFFDDHFYLNPENILYPNSPPPRPFPLSGDDDSRVLTIDSLETIARQLASVCPKKRVPLVVFSDWLNNHMRFHVQAESFRTNHFELRAVFGCAVNYIDWSDFVIHCLELPYPDIDDLLDVKNQYAKLERENKKNDHNPGYFGGTVDKDEYDSVLLWYQKTLPSSPSVHFRHTRIKDLLFTVFSDGGRLDYVRMLLAMCRDDSSVMGLIKAISLVTNRNILIDRQSDVDRTDEMCDVEFFMEALHNTSIICLRNYLAPDESDLRDLLVLLSNIRCDVRKRDTFSITELIENKRFESLSEIGFRFTSTRPFSRFAPQNNE